MPTTTRTIRVFFSSAFSDLKAERNAHQERVFPRFKRYCQRRGWSFQAIDLRWGISHEAALDQSTMRICRAEIACCQAVTPYPNFVVLLGDRYGWRPLPDEIPAAEFEALRPYLPAGLAKRWYRLAENAVCPLPDGTGLDKGRYVLQPRTGDFKDYVLVFSGLPCLTKSRSMTKRNHRFPPLGLAWKRNGTSSRLFRYRGRQCDTAFGNFVTLHRTITFTNGKWGLGELP